MKIYRNTRTGTYFLGDGETVTEYSISDSDGEVEKDSSISEGYYEDGTFPPSYFQVVQLADLPGEIREQVEYDLEE